MICEAQVGCVATNSYLLTQEITETTPILIIIKTNIYYSASLGSARSSAYTSEDMSERIDRPSSISGRGVFVSPANHCCDEVPDPMDMEAMEMDIALAVD
jgi:hypothetical protein